MVTVDYGDWDMHTDVGTVGSGWMKDHLAHLAGSLSAFFADLGSTWRPKVTVVTISEFGRRLGQNGDNGLDPRLRQLHAAARRGRAGGTVHGRWPGLDDPVEGDLAVRQDFRSVLAEVLLSRFPGTSISRVFPGFHRETIGAMR